MYTIQPSLSFSSFLVLLCLVSFKGNWPFDENTLVSRVAHEESEDLFIVATCSQAKKRPRYCEGYIHKGMVSKGYVSTL